MQKTHLNFLENKEKEKEDNMKRQKLFEKGRLDMQLKEENLRKRLSENDDKKHEKMLVENNKVELEEEKISAIRKKEGPIRFR